MQRRDPLVRRLDLERPCTALGPHPAPLHLHHRRPEMERRQPLHPLRRERPVIDPRLDPGPLERRVRLLGPRLARAFKPRARHQRPALPRPRLRRRLRRIVPPEPCLRTARLPVVHPLRDHQVRVRVLPASRVDRERPGQPLRRRQRPREVPDQLPLRVEVQLHRQRHLDRLEQPPVRPLVQVRRVPVRRRPVEALAGPRRHVP